MWQEEEEEGEGRRIGPFKLHPTFSFFSWQGGAGGLGVGTFQIFRYTRNGNTDNTNPILRPLYNRYFCQISIGRGFRIAIGPSESVFLMIYVLAASSSSRSLVVSLSIGPSGDFVKNLPLEYQIVKKSKNLFG